MQNDTTSLIAEARSAYAACLCQQALHSARCRAKPASEMIAQIMKNTGHTESVACEIYTRQKAEATRMKATLTDALDSIEASLSDLKHLSFRLAAALEAATQWRPIESAPKDGTPILIWEPKEPLCGKFGEHHMPLEALLPGENSYLLHDPRIQWYDDRRFAIGYWRPWGGWGNRNSARVNPTHWLPLPAPPEESE